MSGSGEETLRFAEQVIVLLDQGRQTATYKFAVLLGLMDLCLELTDRYGEPPDTIMTGQLAEKVIALYWPHSQPLDAGEGVVLQQSTGKRARVLRLIDDFRSSGSGGRSATLHAAQLADRDGFNVERWARRSVDAKSDLTRIAQDARWPSDRDRTVGSVRGIYLPLPDGVSLWRGPQDFEPSDATSLRAALRVA